MKKLSIECRWIKRGNECHDLYAWGGSSKQSKLLGFVIKNGRFWYVSFENGNRPYDNLIDAMDDVELKWGVKCSAQAGKESE